MPCLVTIPQQFGKGPDVSNYGRDGLWTALPQDGIVNAREAVPVRAKWLWWREDKARGELAISGRRLDAPSSPLMVGIHAGFGNLGFQGSSLAFPAEGCWEITGHAGEARLTFVVLVQWKSLR